MWLGLLFSTLLMLYYGPGMLDQRKTENQTLCERIYPLNSYPESCSVLPIACEWNGTTFSDHTWCFQVRATFFTIDDVPSAPFPPTREVNAICDAHFTRSECFYRLAKTLHFIHFTRFTGWLPYEAIKSEHATCQCVSRDDFFIISPERWKSGPGEWKSGPQDKRSSLNNC